MSAQTTYYWFEERCSEAVADKITGYDETEEFISPDDKRRAMRRSTFKSDKFV